MEIKKLPGLGSYSQPGINKTDKSDKPEPADVREAQPQAKGDTVSLSSEARIFSQAANAAQAAPDVRQDKVEAIKAQIADGTYKSDSKSIAANMVKSDLDIFA